MKIARGLLLAVLAAACGGEEPPAAETPELPTVEVEPALDAELTTAFDAQERRRAGGFSGVLPGGYPADVPPYEPSTLVDFGTDAQGRRMVLLQTPDPPARVRPAMLQRLAADGWACSPAGSDAVDCTKGGRRVGLAWSDARPGTRIHVGY